MTHAFSNGPIIDGVAPRAKLSAVHVKSVVDATGSSSAFNVGINSVITDIVRELPKHVGQAYFGLHVGRDIDFDKDPDINLGDVLAPEDLVKQLQLIRYEGGGDELESQLNSIGIVARTTAWQTEMGTRRAMLVCSSSGSKNTPEGWDAPAVGATCRDLGIKVIVVAPPGVNLHDVAMHSGGVSIPLSNTPDTAELAKVRSLLTKSLTQVASGGGGTVTMVAPPSFGSNGTVVFGG